MRAALALLFVVVGLLTAAPVEATEANGERPRPPVSIASVYTCDFSLAVTTPFANPRLWEHY